MIVGRRRERQGKSKVDSQFVCCDEGGVISLAHHTKGGACVDELGYIELP